MPLADFTIIRVSLPHEGHKQADLNQQVIDLLKSCDPVGRVGSYIGVHEINLAQEGYTPEEGANPTYGMAGKDEKCSASLFTTYAAGNVPEAKIEDFVERLARLHPWEHPVIEVMSKGQTRIWMPQGR